MDQMFSSNLQTELNVLGRKGGEFAPPKSQDPLDKLLHEYYIADRMAAIGTKRKEIAKELIFMERDETIRDMSAEAVKQDMMQQAVVIQTEHYSATLKIAKPVQALDPVACQNELIKLGVDPTTVRKAFDIAMKTRAPAKTLNVITTHERGK